MRIGTAREIRVRPAPLCERLPGRKSPALGASKCVEPRPTGQPGRAVPRFKCAGGILKRLVRETSGAEIAEAAAVLPIMFMIVVGIFWFGQAFSIYGTITRAAQEGARAGAASTCTTCAAGNVADTNAYNAVEAALVAAKLDASKARQPSPVPTLNACSTTVFTGSGTVSCDNSVSGNVCIQSGAQLSNTTGGATGVCGISVSFQYPFQFWLPFTALNKQQIWINAAAQVRMENQ
jgi:Flp pilus assembly protein TadG